MKHWMKWGWWVLMAGVVAGMTSPAAAQTGQVGVTVKVTTPKHESDPKDSFKHTEERMLEITVHNQTNHKIEEATVKYYIVLRDAVNKKSTSLGGRGEKQVTLAGGGTEQISSEPVSITYTEAHSVSRKSVPESGKRYDGYAVQVFIDGKVVGSAFLPAELEKEIDALSKQKLPSEKPKPAPPKAKK